MSNTKEETDGLRLRGISEAGGRKGDGRPARRRAQGHARTEEHHPSRHGERQAGQGQHEDAPGQQEGRQVVEAIVVETGKLAQAWALAGPMVMSAVDIGGDETEDDVLRQLATGAYQLWIIAGSEEILAGMVTEAVVRPLRSVLICRYMGGQDITGWWRPVLKEIKRFARWAGCSEIEFQGKPGSESLAHRAGFKVAHTTFRMTVLDG